MLLPATRLYILATMNGGSFAFLAILMLAHAFMLMIQFASNNVCSRNKFK